MPKNLGNSSAFPIVVPRHTLEQDPGMSLRDYFASAAMTGWLANSAVNNRESIMSMNLTKQAEGFYKLADAMLTARGE